MNAPDFDTLPVLTEVIRPSGFEPEQRLDAQWIREGTAVSSSLPSPQPDLLGQSGIDVGALEQRLIEELMQRLQGLLEQRVHASVAPAVSLLADRIAYKAAQEVAADLADRMREDLQAAVRQAVDDVVHGRR